MKERTQILIEFLATQQNKDIDTSIEDFDLITNSLFSLTQSLYDGQVDIKYYQRELEGKFFRHALANQSIINLIKGNHFRLINSEVIYGDIFSIKSITRMQVESFLLMFYLFFDDVFDSEKDLRYSVYKLHGLRKQSAFPVKTEFAKKQFAKINDEIHESEEQVKSTDNYKFGTTKEQKNLLFPQYPKLVKSNVLFESSGLNKSRMGDMWQIFSNYAHSEHISDRQFNTLYKIDKSIKKDCLTVLYLNSILTAKLAVLISNSSDSAKMKFDKLSLKEKIHLETWNNLDLTNIK